MLFRKLCGRFKFCFMQLKGKSVRVLLDTNVVRKHIYGDPDKLNLGLVKSRLAVLKISLADAAMVELAADLLVDRTVSFDEWRNAVDAFDQIIDQELPIFPGGCELADLANLRVGPRAFTEDSRLYYQCSWRLMAQAQGEKDLEKGISYRDSHGEKVLRFDKAHLNSVIKDQRDGWIGNIQRLSGILTALSVGKNQVRSLINMGLNPMDGESADFGQKLDAVGKTWATFLAMALPGPSPYNPAGEGRKGDVFDFSLLFALSLPDLVIVTADGRFVRSARQTGSQQAKRLLEIDEFNHMLENGELFNLVSSNG
jgi:hypothetical protein